MIASLLLVSLVGGALMGAYVLTTPDAQRVPDQLRRESRKADSQQSSRASVLVPDSRNGQLFLTKREVVTPKGQDARLFVVNEYLRQLHQKGLGEANARAIGIDVRDGVAYLDFNPAFDQSYGTDDEGIVLNGIAATLGQFPEIEKIQYAIDGRPMETMGNIDLTEPQPVIRPGEPLSEGGPPAP